MIDFLDDFNICSNRLLEKKDVLMKLDTLVFLMRQREREKHADPYLYYALVRRVRDQLPYEFQEKIVHQLMQEATCDPHMPGPYAKRAMELYRRVRMAHEIRAA